MIAAATPWLADPKVRAQIKELRADKRIGGEGIRGPFTYFTHQG